MGNIFNKSNKSGPRFRTVVPNHVVGPDIPVKNKNHPNCDYRSNRIKTTKYSALTFLNLPLYLISLDPPCQFSTPIATCTLSVVSPCSTF